MRKITAILAIMLLLLAGCGGADDTSGDEGNTATPAPTVASSGGASAEDTGGTRTGLASGGGERRQDGPVVRIPTSGGEEVVVRVEIADDDDERARGLMGRRSLPEDAGMLFVYGRERQLSFWMRNTYIPLSIAFADSDGRIVDLQDMEPLDDEPPSYVSAEPARYALEVNRGFFEERGVEVGDTMELPERLR